MKKLCLLLALSAFIAFCSGIAYCQDKNTTQSSQPLTKTFEGQVVSVDWVGGKIAVRSDTQYGENEKTFQFSSTVPVTKGVEALGAQDINISDNVIIRYSSDPDGNLNAESITIVQY